MRRLNRARRRARRRAAVAAGRPGADGAEPCAPAAADAARARVIVKYRADSDMMKKQAMTATGRRTLQAQALGDRIGVALDGRRRRLRRARTSSPRRGLTLGQPGGPARAPSADVEYAVVDERKHIVAAPNDPFYASRPATATSGGPAVGQWYLKPPAPDGTAANTAPAAINAEQAWDIDRRHRQRQHRRRRARHRRALRPSRPARGNVAARLRHDRRRRRGSARFATANDGNGRDADASDPGDWITAADKANPIFASCDVSSSAPGTARRRSA